MPSAVTPEAGHRPHWLDEGAWPFETKFLGEDDRRIAYTDVGEGRAVLFVHIGMWSFVWRDVLVRLSKEFRCIAFDAPATGLSGGRAGHEATLANAAESTTRLVEALDLRDLTLAFHDLGGPVALAAARHWPERVTGLVAVNTFGWRPSGAAFRGMLAIMGSRPVRELDAGTGFLARLTSSGFGVGKHQSGHDRRTFRRGVDRRGRRSLHYYMRDARRDDIFGDVEAGMRMLADRPLLTVFGARNDPLQFQEQWQERFPGLRQVVVPKGNHFPMCDDPDEVSREMRHWLRRQRPAGAAGSLE